MSDPSVIYAIEDHKARIDAMLKRLQQLSDDHFNIDPDAATWSNEADVCQLHYLLSQAVKCAFNGDENGDG